MKPSTLLFWTLMASLLLGATALWWSPLNQDEGWYLVAAQRVNQGHLPYRDFAFTQGPVLPYVYQGALPLIRSFGLLGGRLYSYIWSVLSLLVIVFTLRRHLPSQYRLFAVTLAISLLGLNPFFAQFSATVKTYSLAGFFLVLALSARIEFQKSHHPVHIGLCALMLAAATATRLSLGLMFIPLGLELVHKRKRLGHNPWMTFAAAGLLGLAPAFVPFLLLAPEGLHFGLWEFHAGRMTDAPWLLRAGFLSRTLQHLLPAAVCLILLIPRWKHWQHGMFPALTGLALISLFHLFAPYPYDEYQTLLFPALTLLLAFELPNHLPAEKLTLAASVATLSCLLFALSSPVLQGWFSRGQDRIWIQSANKSQLHQLRDTAKQLHTLAPGARELFTTDLYLAIEAGLDVPPGLELGPFCYYPEWTTSRSKKLHVLNAERLADLIEQSETPLAAFSGYSFRIQSPSITPVPEEHFEQIRQNLLTRYRPVAVAEPFGQANTRLDIYQIKKEPTLLNRE
ncbi:MAG: hypothetical protein WD708_11835 [Kiritimatiellia bacterium]